MAKIAWFDPEMLFWLISGEQSVKDFLAPHRSKMNYAKKWEKPACVERFSHIFAPKVAVWGLVSASHEAEAIFFDDQSSLPCKRAGFTEFTDCDPFIPQILL